MQHDQQEEVEYESEDERDDLGLFNWSEKDVCDISLLEPDWNI